MSLIHSNRELKIMLNGLEISFIKVALKCFLKSDVLDKQKSTIDENVSTVKHKQKMAKIV